MNCKNRVLNNEIKKSLTHGIIPKFASSIGTWFVILQLSIKVSGSLLFTRILEICDLASFVTYNPSLVNTIKEGIVFTQNCEDNELIIFCEIPPGVCNGIANQGMDA